MISIQVLDSLLYVLGAVYHRGGLLDIAALIKPFGQMHTVHSNPTRVATCSHVAPSNFVISRPVVPAHKAHLPKTCSSPVTSCFKPSLDVKPSHRNSTRTQAYSQPLSTGTVVKTTTSEIRWGSCIVKQDTCNLPAAVNEAVKNILDSIGHDSEPELAMVFISSVYGQEFEDLVPLLREKIPSLKHIFGCSVRDLVVSSAIQIQNIFGLVISHQIKY